MSGYRRIQTGGSDRIVTAVLHAGDPSSPLTGLATVVLSIWRMNGAAIEWYDFSDLTFKAAGWTTLQQVMAALDTARSPGVYQYLWATAGITNPNADDSYFYRVTDTSSQARNIPQEGMLDVGQYPDKLDALVSSRAVPGDAMALTVGERAALDAALSAAHGVGSWEGLGSSAVAAAVWDEAAAGHVAPGSFGEEEQSHATPVEVLAAVGVGLAAYDAATGVQVASRAAPGDAMDLVTDAVDAGALADSAVAEINAGLSAIHGAGSWEGPSPAAIATAVWDEALPGAHAAGSAGRLVADLEARLTLARAAYLDQIPGLAVDTALLKKIPINRLELSEAGSGTWILYDDDNVTPLLTWPVRDKDGDEIRMSKYVPARRGRGV